jgi:hypothetical protein
MIELGTRGEYPDRASDQGEPKTDVLLHVEVLRGARSIKSE